MAGATTLAASFWSLPLAWQLMLVGVEVAAGEAPVAARRLTAWRAGRNRGRAMLEIVRPRER